jgi:chemotaxis protein MotB
MARRRRALQDEANHDRWLVSYADFITLLFAFFVVMYAISSVNEGKYRVLADSLNAVFADPSELDRPMPTVAASPVVKALEPAVIPSPIPVQPPVQRDEPPADHDIAAVAQRISITLQSYIDDGLVEIARVGDRLQLQIKSKLLFDSGSAQLAGTALGALRDLARILTPLPNQLQVEGHTDDVPISTLQFPSNWELSAARAASVVHFFNRLGVPADRLAAIGYGEHRPIASNATEDGKARNRRVTLMILPVEAVPWAEGPAVPEPVQGGGIVTPEQLAGDGAGSTAKP